MTRAAPPPLIQRATGKRRKRRGVLRWLRRLLLLAVLWLCGDDASFVHGQAIVVDGAITSR